MLTKLKSEKPGDQTYRVEKPGDPRKNDALKSKSGRFLGVTRLLTPRKIPC